MMELTDIRKFLEFLAPHPRGRTPVRRLAESGHHLPHRARAVSKLNLKIYRLRRTWVRVLSGVNGTDSPNAHLPALAA
ncbi:hypothetical protein EVAR_62624_1 [Eumeta japonica]|uniref:Uncharacterized protein n=1 Tax=Eumeta variegata TaxID=151549 RepID=A0A4C1ZKU0_EUMVA|nr:hypothetical protein EVAR_62624_1 [Eumeta japonica]